MKLDENNKFSLKTTPGKSGVFVSTDKLKEAEIQLTSIESQGDEVAATVHGSVAEVLLEIVLGKIFGKTNLGSAKLDPEKLNVDFVKLNIRPGSNIQFRDVDLGKVTDGVVEFRKIVWSEANKVVTGDVNANLAFTDGFSFTNSKISLNADKGKVAIAGEASWDSGKDSYLLQGAPCLTFKCDKIVFKNQRKQVALSTASLAAGKCIWNPRNEIATATNLSLGTVLNLSAMNVPVPVQLTVENASALFDGSTANLSLPIRASVQNARKIFDEIAHRKFPGGNKKSFGHGPLKAEIYRRGDHLKHTFISCSGDTISLSSRIAVDPKLYKTMRQVDFSTKVSVSINSKGGVNFGFEELNVSGLNNGIDRAVGDAIAKEVNGEIVSKEILASGGITKLSALKFSGNEKVLAVDANVEVSTR